jgi:CelD/BcsL family acetyltransferase involved in cellulose biosynthesis
MSESVLTEFALQPERVAHSHEAARPLTYRVERITEAGLSDPLQAEWNFLHDNLHPRTPFTSPLWNILWWKHFRGIRRSMGNELFVNSVRDPSGCLIAVAPMMATDIPSFGPLRMRALRCLGADANITELRGLVCAPEDEVQVFDLLRDHVTKTHRFDWIDWGTVRQHNWRPLTSRIPRGLAVSDAAITDYHLSLPASWDEFRGTRSRNVKESIRKCYNSLKRDGHTAHLRVIDSPTECVEGIQTFLTLHAKRSAAENVTVRHPNVFESEQARAFILEYAQAMARRNQLRLFQLHIGGAVVATRIGFLFDDELYLYYSGYETEWARYSVMTTLVVEAIKWAIENRLKIVNLSTGTDVSKLRWGPTQTDYRCLIEAMPGLRQRLSFATYRLLKSRSRRASTQAATNVDTRT